MASYVAPVSTFDTEGQEIARRRKMAEMLMQQSQSPLDMPSTPAGGFTPRVSPFQGIAKLVQGFVGNQQQKQLAEEEQGLAKRRQEAMAAAVRDMPQARTESVDAPAGTVEADLGVGSERQVQPTMAQNAGWLTGLDAISPGMSQMGMGLLNMQQRNQPKPEEGFTLGPNQNRYSGTGALIASAPAVPKAPEGYTLAPNQTRYSPDNQLLVTAPPAPTAPQESWSEPYELGGAQVQRNTLTGQIRQAVNRPPSITVSPTINAGTGDKQYLEQRGKGRAQQMEALEKSAEAAHRANQAMDRFIAASKGGTQGGVQPLISGVQNMLASFGYAPAQLTDVRKMEQAVGDVLQNRMAELGARGLTDKDMEVLRSALPQVATDRTSRDAVAGIVKRANAATIQEYMMQREEEQKSYPDMASRIPAPAWLRGYQPQQAPAGAGALNPAEQAELQRLRAKHGKRP